ncbi:MAG TPA: PAS domain S-box protein, partial [Alphaproteobacteria bacterium]|nr:PAS domain S-box protein [Alphaproteobacteria bacterium]
MDTPRRDGHEREYLRLLRATPLPVAIHRKGRWRFLNDAAVELLGLHDAAALVGRPVTDVIAEEDRGAAAARRAEVEAGGRAVDAREFRIIRPDGEILHVESRSIPVTFEGRPSSLTTVRNVTEAREAQRALHRSEAEFRSVAESA